VTMGATTIWERWDGIKPDGTFQDPHMNSFNHYAYGAIGEWMYRVVAGIGIDESRPGYKHILIAPRPGGDLNDAKASVDSIYGEVGAGWEIANGKIRLHVQIPPNATATVRIPKAKLKDVSEAGRPLAECSGLTDTRQDGEAVIVELGSGKYSFESPYGN